MTTLREFSPTIRAALVLAALLLVPRIATAAVVTLSIPNVEGKAGQDVEVSIAVKNAKGLRALQCVLTYDPSILEVSKDADASKLIVRGASLPENAILNVYTTTIPPAVGPDGNPVGAPTPVKPGRIYIMLLGGGDESKKTIQSVEQDGTLLTIRFRVIGQPGQKSPLALDMAEAFQGDGMDMLVKVEAGEVTVASASSGLPWMWILAGLGAALLLLIILLLTRRKRSAR